MLQKIHYGESPRNSVKARKRFEMVVREFEAGEAERWAALRGLLWPEADRVKLAAEAEDFLQGREVPTIAAAFVAEHGDSALGFLELAVRSFSDGCESMPVPHVEGLYVEPFARGRGVGSALMRRAEEWSRERGFTELASDTEIDNAASLAFHRRAGFVEVERLIKLRKSLRDV